MIRFLFVLALFVVGGAQAQNPYYNGPATHTGMDHINRIVRGTPGLSLAGTSVGANVSASGAVNVNTATGLRIPVPVTATATISKEALASAAAKLFKGAGIVGAAYTGYELYTWLTDNFEPCPAPNFFCKPGVVTREQYLDSGGWDCPAAHGYPAGSPSACFASLGYGQPQNPQFTVGSCVMEGTLTLACQAVQYGNPVGTIRAPRNSPITFTAEPSAMSETEVADHLKGTNWDPNRAPALYDAIRADNKRQGLLQDAEIVPPSSPVTVTAPPVTTPQRTIRERTIVNPDSTTSTETTTEQTTVTPTTTGTTVGDSKTDFKTQTTTITTTINNTTNETTTITEVDTPPTQESPSEEQTDPCVEHPNRVGCADLGDPPDQEELPEEENEAEYEPLFFASAAGCPAPISMDLGPFGSTEGLSFQPFCNTMGLLRPLFLACASLACALIFIRGMTTV